MSTTVTSSTSLVGRWRLALRFGLREARRHKGRSALVMAMVLLPMAVGTLLIIVSAPPSAQAVVAAWLGPQLAGYVEWMGPYPIRQDVFGANTERVEIGTTNDDAAITETDVITSEITTNLPEGLAASPYLENFSGIYLGNEYVNTYLLQADLTDPAIRAVLPVSEGELPGPGQIALNAYAADQIGAHLGDVVTVMIEQALPNAPGQTELQEVELQVSGIRRAAIGN